MLKPRYSNRYVRDIRIGQMIRRRGQERSVGWWFVTEIEQNTTSGRTRLGFDCGGYLYINPDEIVDVYLGTAAVTTVNTLGAIFDDMEKSLEELKRVVQPTSTEV